MAHVVVVSKGLARQYAWLRADKLSVIYNFLPASRASEPETFGFLSDDVRYIVGMGRLEPEKGFDRLIKAFHRVEKDCPGWKLIIVGEGSLRAELDPADRVARPDGTDRATRASEQPVYPVPAVRSILPVVGK